MLSLIRAKTLQSPVWLVLPVVLCNLIIYVVIGLPMAVIPVFTHSSLHFNAILAGFAVSVQYFATFASRSSSGRRIDTLGPKAVVLPGLILGVLSALLLLAAGLTASKATLSLTLLLGSRLILGWAESWVTTSAIVWCIQRVGPHFTAQAISWSGITSYGGLALGATLGENLSHLPGIWGGLVTLSLLSSLLPVIGYFLAKSYPGVAPLRQDKPAMPFIEVLKLVLPHGGALAAGSVGFGAISSCLALYFSANQWDGAALALSAFGFVFVIVRFFFARQIGRLGGTKVAKVSLCVETFGLLLLSIMPTAGTAMLGAAVTGAGFALVFPSLGVLAVDRGGAENRGAVLGAFSVFFDIALGVSGPLLGIVIHFAGYRSLFVFSACITTLGVLQVIRLQRAATA